MGRERKGAFDAGGARETESRVGLDLAVSPLVDSLERPRVVQLVEVQSPGLRPARGLTDAGRQRTISLPSKRR